MKKCTRSAGKALIVAFLLLSGTLISVVVHHRQVAIEYIHANTPLLLQEAVKENAKSKTTSIPSSGFAYTPEKIGIAEVRTFKTGDTTFTYNYKIADMETEILDSRQSFLLLADDLHSHDIKVILDSLLRQKNISGQTTVGLTASFYKRLNDWTPQSDTANMKFDYQTHLGEQGLLGDIHYHAGINYSFATLWKLMPHTSILFLLLLEVLTCCFCIGYIIKRKYDQKRVVQSEKEEQAIPYSIIETNELTAKIDVGLTGQLLDLFQLFSENNGQVSKEVIKKKFWPKSANPTTNMTTLVDRLKKKLAEAEHPYTIITNPEDDRYYQLTLVSKQNA